jgi:predicted amino acid-binding ACT domain protein
MSCFSNRYKHYIFAVDVTTVEKSFANVVFIACSCDKKNITRLGLNMQQKTKTLGLSGQMVEALGQRAMKYAQSFSRDGVAMKRDG